MALEQDREYRSRKKPNISARQVEQDYRSKSTSAKHRRNGQDKEQTSRPGKLQRTNASSARDSKSGETKGPRDGCLKCGGAHYLSKCPDASEEEKRNRLCLHCGERKKDTGRKVKRAKRIKDCLVEDDRSILINGKLRMPYCADSGSDNSIIGRSKAEELAKLDNRVILQPLEQPVLSKAVGDRIITARNVIEVRILIHTAAGPVTPTQRFRCFVIEDR